MGFLRNLIRRKSIETLQNDAENSGMKRRLSGIDLILIGVGEIIGAGIFVMTGKAALLYAGPGIMLSYIIAGTACVFAGLCYAEMASMIPVAGSAYTYAYTTCGELMGWVVGWDLMLEYLIGAATVAVGWSEYLIAFLRNDCGMTIGDSLVLPPIEFDDITGSFKAGGGYINIPAIAIVALCTVVLVLGVRQSAIVNHIFVTIKIVVILLFLFSTFSYINPQNWKPFIPAAIEGADHKYGFSGVFHAATIVFFAYIGFDAVSTLSQETRNPTRDMPIGILGSLIISTAFYILVSMNITGIVKYTEIPVRASLSAVSKNIGMGWLSVCINIGAIAGLTSVILVSLLSQPRIFYSMAYDGLLPAVFAKVHPDYGTPYLTTITGGVLCAIASGFLPESFLGTVTSAGTLFAFGLVSLSVGILRFTRPDIKRSFRVPGGPILIPFLGLAFSAALIIIAGGTTVLRLAIWLAIGFVVYFAYGYRHSKIGRGEVMGDIPMHKQSANKVPLETEV